MSRERKLIGPNFLFYGHSFWIWPPRVAYCNSLCWWVFRYYKEITVRVIVNFIGGLECSLLMVLFIWIMLISDIHWGRVERSGKDAEVD